MLPRHRTARKKIAHPSTFPSSSHCAHVTIGNAPQSERVAWSAGQLPSGMCHVSQPLAAVMARIAGCQRAGTQHLAERETPALKMENGRGSNPSRSRDLSSETSQAPRGHDRTVLNQRNRTHEPV